MEKTKKATFGAGCFWGVEEAFRTTKGVLSTSVGYMGGTRDDPTYEDICTDTTGHVEVVQVEFNPSVVSYALLLDIFWKIHDPTQTDGQGPDIGSQYRSVVFYHSPAQRRAAEDSRNALEQKLGRKTATKIIAASQFWKAEEYHQKYLMKRGLKTCHF